MEPSSSKNSQSTGNDLQPQISSEGKVDSERKNHIQAKESLKSNKSSDEAENSENGAASASEPLPRNHFGKTHVISSEEDENKFVEEAKTSENGAASASEPLPRNHFEKKFVEEAKINESIAASASEPLPRNHFEKKFVEEAKINESIAGSASEPLLSSNIENINLITSEERGNRVAMTNRLDKETKICEKNAASGSEPLPISNSEELNVITSEKHIQPVKKINVQKLLEVSQKLGTIFTYQTRDRQRVKFSSQPQPRSQSASSAASRFYASTNPESSERSQPPPQQSSSASRDRGRQEVKNKKPNKEHRVYTQRGEQSYDVPHFVPLNHMAFSPQFVVRGQVVNERGSPRLRSSLAPLADCEVLFVIQQLDILEFVYNITEPNFYVILNSKAECIYYAYETSSFCAQSCLGYKREMQLHVMDSHDNEVIFMNKHFGCTFLFCCYPVMEVYSPPEVPLGAITKVCTCHSEKLVIIDPDENVMFTIQGVGVCERCWKCLNADLTIHALDPQRTLVGNIRREFVGNPYVPLSNADYYGISFPRNMDVKIKALFLGALFLVSLKRTGWVLRNVEDPETISGHMYRMSIMTFLIPESSGVDKTKCMKLSLVHDLAECIVGDLTPFCGVDANEKHRQEEVAMKELTKMIGVSGAEIYTLYKEYEAQVTEESKFVKDLDRLDMILQAFEYEKLGEKPGKLEEFFTSTFNKFHFPWTIDIVKEIYKQRNFHINKDKNLGKDP